MEPRIRRLLEEFDTPARASSAAQGLALGDLGDPAELRPLAEELVAQGWLRLSPAPDTFTRTEEGRLAIAGPLDVTIYTRPGCHLCEEMKAQAAPLIRRAGATLSEINIDADPLLHERYNVEVPVLLLGARKVAKYHLDAEQFRRQLGAARRAGATQD
jgi:glutaredoxin